MDRPTRQIMARGGQASRFGIGPDESPQTPGPISFPVARPRTVRVAPLRAVRTARYLTFSTLAVLLLLASSVRPPHVAGQSVSVSSSAPAPPVDLKQLPPETRLREGSRLADERGYFRLAGDRVAFHTADGSRRLIVLENLNLERIINQITATGEESLWSVSGQVTECRGLNYLLVTHAVLKSDAPAATP